MVWFRFLKLDACSGTPATIAAWQRTAPATRISWRGGSERTDRPTTALASWFVSRDASISGLRLHQFSVHQFLLIENGAFSGNGFTEAFHVTRFQGGHASGVRRLEAAAQNP